MDSMHHDQLKGNYLSSLHRNIKNNTSLIEANNLPTEKLDLRKKKSISSAVKSVNNRSFGRKVVDEHTKHQSVARTLPINSPHSPLLADKTTYNNLNETQLFGRYIKNTNILYNAEKSAIYEYSKTDSVNSSPTKTATSTTLSSKLVCCCEKSEIESIEHFSNKATLETAIKHCLVSTRNATTSPRFQIREVGSMASRGISQSLTNDICVKAIDINKLKMFTKNSLPYGEGYIKAKEKKKSVVESNPLKTLRTSRSLSPKPPIRYQHTMLVPDSHDAHTYFFSLSKGNTPSEKKQIYQLCHSEQSSPNVIEKQFSYIASTNRSTGCLSNSYTDPWLKNIHVGNKSSIPLPTPKKGKRTSSPNRESNVIRDPWIKRRDVEQMSQIFRNELLRQAKSFSASKFDVESIITDPPFLNRTKPSSCLNAEPNSTSIISTQNQMQSAPTSPQCLTTAENNLISSDYLTNKQRPGSFIEKSCPRSVSFSPARTNKSHNPFRYYNLHLSDSPPPLISVAAGIILKEQNRSKLNTRSENHEFLNVCNPDLLTARHSFSSVTDQAQGEELQLNIRRLSEQMRRRDVTDNIKIFASDCNIRENLNDEKEVFKSANDTTNSVTCPLPRVDFSEYLQQFRCSETKKTAQQQKENKCFLKDKFLTTTSSNHQSIPINKTEQSIDCILETTC